MQQPGAQRRLSSCWASSQQVAYVVSWLNEAQMKPRCASGASAASWDSIRAAKSSPLSPNEVGGLWARVNPFRNPLPLLSAPPTQSATLALFGGGEECPGLALSDHTHRTTEWNRDRNQRLDYRWTIRKKEKNPQRFLSHARQCFYYVVNFQYPHSKTKTADGWCVTPRCVAIGRRQ